MEKGDSKLVGKELYEANRLFRDMCDDGFVSNVVT